ncbi:MAG: PIN domain-containing protein [Candidatus Diapherotrites archaeon]|nr:PIN domain-containing protein [Candidatus Diapherotrites archaeon]
MRLYLDSNVFISLIKCEIGKGFKAMESKVIDFFESCARNKHEIVLSELFFEEVRANAFYSKEETVSFFEERKINTEIISFKGEHFEEIKKWDSIGIHKRDRMHFFLAIKTGCNAIVTWNLKDFIPAEKFIKIMAPEDLD